MRRTRSHKTILTNHEDVERAIRRPQKTLSPMRSRHMNGVDASVELVRELDRLSESSDGAL